MSEIEQDRAAWDAWKRNTMDTRATQNLLEQLHGPIMTAVNSYRNASLPLPLLELEAKRAALESLRDYQPSYGLSMSTYVITTVKQKLSRYVLSYQNVVRVPEYTARKIGPVLTAEKDLTQRFGREPTVHEISDHLAIPVRDVVRAQKSTRRESLESALDEIPGEADDLSMERLRLSYYSLNPDEQLVFDYSLGEHGKQKLSSGDIAKKLKLSPGRVSQIKAQIAGKIKKYVS